MLTKTLTSDGERYYSYNKQIAWRSGPRRWSVVQPVEKVSAHNKLNADNPASVTTNKHIRKVQAFLAERGYKVVEVPY
jgi:hypothetical protein